MDSIAANPTVALSAVTTCAPTVGPKDGSFTLQFKSAMAIGTAEVVTNEKEKIEALRAICLRFLPKHMDAFDASIARSLSRTAVVKITLTAQPTGKRKQCDKQHGTHTIEHAEAIGLGTRKYNLVSIDKK